MGKARRCGNKRGYRSRRAANNARFRLARETGGRPGAMSAYKCPYCLAWHIGHTPRRR